MHFKRGENSFTEKNVFRIAILHFTHMIYFLSTQMGFSQIEGFSRFSAKKKKFLHLKMYFF